LNSTEVITQTPNKGLMTNEGHASLIGLDLK
jgi:hypothetical protein